MTDLETTRTGAVTRTPAGDDELIRCTIVTAGPAPKGATDARV